MHTGDLVVIDADGYCSIKGRIKDIIIRGGENISPVEIEDFLCQHEGIAEVHVIVIPDDKHGEEVCAWIRLKEGCHLDVLTVIEFCRARIASYKVPKAIRFIDQFPTTALRQGLEIRHARGDAQRTRLTPALRRRLPLRGRCFW
jgi:fatty-acyl-CoA synthase